MQERIFKNLTWKKRLHGAGALKVQQELLQV